VDSSIFIENKKNYGGKGVYIGRPSIFGNPFSNKKSGLRVIETKTAEESVSKYEKYFVQRIKSDPYFRREFIRLVDTYEENDSITLICWCNPHPCHGEILKKYILLSIEKRERTGENG